MGTPEKSADQVKRFIESARKLGCDNDKNRFEARLGKVAKVKAKEIREEGAPKRAPRSTKAKISR
jgi:hypothetical protein